MPPLEKKEDNLNVFAKWPIYFMVRERKKLIRNSTKNFVKPKMPLKKPQHCNEFY